MLKQMATYVDLFIYQAFTLNSVPPTQEEIIGGGIGRNFISRDLLEASGLGDALNVRHFLVSTDD